MSPSSHKVASTAVALALALGGLGLPAVAAAPAQAAAPAVSSRLPGSITSALKTNYPVPSGALFVSPSGSNSNAGTQAAPFKTLNFALTKAKAGSTVVMRGGTYREGASGYSVGGTYYVIQPTNVSIQAYPGETVWMDGTVKVTKWKKVSKNHYKVAWSTPSFCAGKYYSRHFSSQTTSGPCSYSDAVGGTASVGDPQMVFVNGSQIKEVTSTKKLKSGTFFYDWKKRVMHIGFSPSKKTVEVTKYPQALALFKPTDVSIKGIGFRRYATNQFANATAAALLLNAGTNVTLENVVITQSAGSGLLSWGTRNLTIRSSILSANGANGLDFSGSAVKHASDSSIRDDLVVEYSRLEGNNADSYSVNCSYSCSAAGFKGSGVVGANFRFSVISKNGGKRASGLWFDLNSMQANIYGNQVVGNARHGIVYEVSSGGVIASNLVRDNGFGNNAGGGGFGIMMGSASTRLYNNTVGDNRNGIHLFDDSRSPGSGYGYDPTRVGPNTVDIVMANNVVTASSTASYCLLAATGGKSTIAGNTTPESFLKTLDHNTYAAPSAVQFVNWNTHEDSPAKVFSTLPDLQSAKGKEANGTLVRGTSVSVSAKDGVPLPSDIAEMLGQGSGAVDRGVLTLGG